MAGRALDRIDFDILAALQNDGRLSNKELAASVGLAPSSCLERVRALRESGVLQGFRAEVDPPSVGIQLQAMIAIRLALHSREVFDHFREHVLAMPEVVSAWYVSGREDFLLFVAVRDTAHLRDLTLDRLSTRPEVAHLETALVFEHFGGRPLPLYRAAD
jgi:DNA-binding Lrp family transcriptional regulator